MSNLATGGTIAFAGHWKGNGSGTSCNTTITSTASLSLTVATLIFTGGTPSSVSVTDNASTPNTYAQATTIGTTGTGGGAIMYQFYGVQITAGATSLNISWTGSATLEVQIDNFTGAAATNATVFDKTQTVVAASSSSLAMTSFTPTQAHSLVVAGYAFTSGTTNVTAGSKYVDFGTTTAVTSASEYRFLSGATETAPMTLANARAYTGIAGVYKAAATTGPIIINGMTTHGSGSSVNLPGVPAANNLLVMFQISNGGTTTTPVGWTLLSSPNWDTSSRTAYAFYKVAAGTETTASSSLTGTSETIVLEIAGLATSSVTDGTPTSGFGTAASLALPSVTTTNANDVVLYFVAMNGTTSSEAFSTSNVLYNFFQPDGNVYDMIIGARVVSATGSYADTATWTTSRPNVGMIQAFKQLSSGSNFSQTPSDTATTSDSAVKNPVKNTSDSSTTSDAESNRLTKNLSDSSTTSDAITKNYGRRPSDSVTSTDSLYRAPSLGRSETVTATESITKNPAATKADTVTTGDSPTATLTHPKAATFSDDFNDNSISSAYTNWGLSQVTESSQHLNISSTLFGAYYGIYTNNRYDLTSSAVFVQLVDAGDQSIPSWEVYVPNLTGPTDSDGVHILISGNTIYCRKYVSNANSQVGSSVSYNPAVHKWFQIRETSGTLYYEYATIGDGSDWTVMNSVATSSLSVDLTKIKLELMIGTYQTEASTTTAMFDNFNVSGASSVNYSQTPSDTVTSSDSASRTLVKNSTDSTTASESSVRSTTVNKADTVTSSESSVRKSAKTVADTQTVAENPFKNYATSRSDSVTLSDSASPKVILLLTVSDSVTSADSARRAVGKFLNDTVNTAMLSNLGTQWQRVFADGLSAAETSSHRLTLNRTDQATLSEIATRAFAAGRNDTVTLDDATSRRVIKLLQDSSSATDVFHSDRLADVSFTTPITLHMGGGSIILSANGHNSTISLMTKQP